MRYKKKCKTVVGRGQISNSWKANFVVALIHRFSKDIISPLEVLYRISKVIILFFSSGFSLSSYEFDHLFCSSAKALETIQLHEVFLKQVEATGCTSCWNRTWIFTDYHSPKHFQVNILSGKYLTILIYILQLLHSKGGLLPHSVIHLYYTKETVLKQPQGVPGWLCQKSI